MRKNRANIVFPAHFTRNEIGVVEYQDEVPTSEERPFDGAEPDHF